MSEEKKKIVNARIEKEYTVDSNKNIDINTASLIEQNANLIRILQKSDKYDSKKFEPFTKTIVKIEKILPKED